MKIFLSYAAEDRVVADEVNLALRGAGHNVFFDRDALPPGADYLPMIQAKLKNCEVMVFLISPHSIRSDCYTQSELNAWRRRWPNPAGRLLPVMVESIPITSIEPYLRNVTVKSANGNTAFDVVAAVGKLPSFRAPRKRMSPPTLSNGLLTEYLKYLDDERSALNTLCWFAIALAVFAAFWKVFDAVSDMHLVAGAALALIAMLFFLRQRSDFSWLRGQIALARIRTRPGGVTLRDWLNYADGWAVWLPYRSGWTAIFGSIACYVAAFVPNIGLFSRWLTLGVPLLLLAIFSTVRWRIFTTYSDSSNPLQEWWNS